MNNMDLTPQMLLNAIQMYDFYLYELQLYLDTHPTCRNGLNAFKRYKELRAQAVSAYNQRYGPITALESDCDNQFSWAAGPWPWERGAN
ncbi:MAG: spore coat protein CotJB [Huintestinicola sp.]